MILALALTEPGAWYRQDGIRTKITDNGNNYILNGTKIFVENAHISDYILCAVRDESSPQTANGLSIILVDRKSPGIQITLLDTLAYDKQCEIFFDHVSVPKKNVFGPVGEPSSILEKLQEQAAVAKCAIS